MTLQAPYSFTKNYHHEPYPAIDPTRPELSAKGKVIFITGGSRGIGLAIAESFAQAGAADIFISGRQQGSLERSKAKIEGAHKSHVHPLVFDVVDTAAVEAAFAQVKKDIGPIDVVVSNAGYLSTGLLGDISPDDFWRAFEINTKGSFNVIKAVIKFAAKNAVLISINSGVVHLPPEFITIASYAASKAATAKMHEYLQAEQPDLRVFSLQPGGIPTEMSLGAGVPKELLPDGKSSLHVQVDRQLLVHM